MLGKCLLHPRAFVHVEIVQHHDMPLAKGWRELGCNMSAEAVAIHRVIKNLRYGELDTRKNPRRLLSDRRILRI